LPHAVLPTLKPIAGGERDKMSNFLWRRYEAWLNQPYQEISTTQSRKQNLRDIAVLVICCFLLASIGRYLNQDVIDRLYRALVALKFEALLLKTQHLSFVQDYLSAAPERWRRVVVHYALMLGGLIPAYIMLRNSWRTFAVIQRRTWQKTEVLPKYKYRGQRLLLLLVIAFGSWCFFISYLIAADFVWLAPEAMRNEAYDCGDHIGKGARVHCLFKSFINQSSIHYSDAGFFHLAIVVPIMTLFLNLLMFIGFAITVILSQDVKLKRLQASELPPSFTWRP
jgi:hypothetical protein